MQTRFIKFQNGKVWRVGAEDEVTGTVLVPRFAEKKDRVDRHDAIATAVTGSILGMDDIQYTMLDGNKVRFSGYVALPAEGPTRCTELDVNSSELRTLLAAQYSLTPLEVEHALDNLHVQYGEENVVPIAGSGREIRCPVRTDLGSYVRVVVDGLEIAYWNSGELAREPDDVLGALFVTARG
ncbi:hypothetical protein DIE18_04020 [Burkholderia sp. Bp9125]|nr:hypothetical protein DIE18_04020 [Burkholderia sp. Bp9125]